MVAEVSGTVNVTAMNPCKGSEEDWPDPGELVSSLPIRLPTAYRPAQGMTSFCCDAEIVVAPEWGGWKCKKCNGIQTIDAHNGEFDTNSTVRIAAWLARAMPPGARPRFVHAASRVEASERHRKPIPPDFGIWFRELDGRTTSRTTLP